MAITSGFFNSLSGDRVYSAEEFSQMFDGIVIDGIFKSVGDALEVTPLTGLTVNVGVGRAWFDHTWTYNSSDAEFALSPAAELQDRIDAIVLEVNAGDGVRHNTIKVVTGTPSSTPVQPTMVKDDANKVYQYPLCYILVTANMTSIQPENITDMRGTSQCPFAAVVEDMSDIRTYAHITDGTIYIGNEHVTPVSLEAGRANQMVKANLEAEAGLGTAQMRDIYAGTAAMEAGTTNLTTGVIYCQYE